MSKGHEEEASRPESPTRRMSRNDPSFAARQVLYSCLMTALLFGMAGILSPSSIVQQQELQQLQEKMVDRVHTMQSLIHLRGGQLEEDAAMMLLHLRGKDISHEQGLAAKIQKDPGSYVPISCSEVLSDQLEKDEVSNTANDDPNQRILHARQVVRKDNPNFWVSLHKEEFDFTRWIIMKKGDYYEKALSAAFSEILQDQSQSKEQRVIDVGGNIGFFSLLSASNGPNVVVDAFEPNPKNRLRFCQSLRLNQWENEYNSVSTSHSGSQVNVYPYGVGQEEGVFSFVEHDNPGQGKFLPTKPREGSKHHHLATEMRVIKLDEFAQARGWLDDEESHPDIAILKVDVEGLDALVIKGAATLIQAKIIRNIFMEVSAPKRKSQEGLEDIKQALQIIQQAGYKLHRIGGWMGPNHPFEDAPSDPKLLVDAIVEKTQNTKSGQLNLWWALEGEERSSGE